MSDKISEGILISIHKINDKSLIIKILDKSNQLYSGILARHKGTKLSLLDAIQYKFSVKPGKELIQVTEADKMKNSVSLRIQSSYDQYFILAELLQEVLSEKTEDEGLYLLIQELLEDFKGDLDPEYHLYFLVRLLVFFGYSPDHINSGIYFDLREARRVLSAPAHPDYCDASFVDYFYQFHLQKRLSYVFKNASERYQYFLALVRFLELQSGIKIHLNSIEILRQLRD